ncbi:MAG: glycosyltransferase [Candidatus Omnitrophica bacterium]|nr:glycosyltransferase [Candidatus Omnitrophota bacterium]
MIVSIIIAVKTWQGNLEECVNKCLALDYKDYEIIVLPDESLDKKTVNPRVRFFSTGPVSPAIKRDKGMEFAQGEILAFIDDDAFPEKDWLKEAVKNFSDPNVAAVGGPAVTPVNDGLREKASGIIFSSLLVSGACFYRYTRYGKRLEIDDYPSCNFLVRKEVMRKLGGFKTGFWPGEDTVFCLEITKKLKLKIIYEPRALVYHHRREVFLPHLRQLANYALHRGYFVKRFPETSRRIAYFVPGFFLIWVAVGFLFSVFSVSFAFVYWGVLSFYASLVVIFSYAGMLREQGISGYDFRQWSSLFFMVCGGIVASHLTYGFYFLKGLFSANLAEDRQG